MTEVRFGRKVWARFGHQRRLGQMAPLGLAMALGASLSAAAQPVSVPLPIPADRTAPATKPDRAKPDLARSDPIGALLARQGLTGTANVPMVIGLKLGETPAKSRFTVELSDPVDVRVFTLT